MADSDPALRLLSLLICNLLSWVKCHLVLECQDQARYPPCVPQKHPVLPSFVVPTPLLCHTYLPQSIRNFNKDKDFPVFTATSLVPSSVWYSVKFVNERKNQQFSWLFLEFGHHTSDPFFGFRPLGEYDGSDNSFNSKLTSIRGIHSSQICLTLCNQPCLLLSPPSCRQPGSVK